jgi:hypothetical protein
MAELTEDVDRDTTDRSTHDLPSDPSAVSTSAPAPARPTARTAAPAEFTPADRFMRRLLRVGDQIDPSALLGAQQALSRSILVSAVRCTITYLLIPILGSAIGLLDVFGPALSIALCLFAGFMSIRSMRRFWIADHPKRWAYTAFASVVLVALTIGIAVDVVRLFGR